MRQLAATCIAALLCACAARASGPASTERATPAPLNSDERAIVSYVDAHADEALVLIRQVVDIDSPTEDLAGVRKVGKVFEAEFAKIGMSARWLDLPPDMKRAGHLLAETKGTRGKRLLLLGHIDTVLRGERFRREDGKGFGTGISDMKGGAVVLLYALKALHAAGVLKDTRLKVLYTGDEENPGTPVEISRGAMVAAAKDSDAALSFEPTIRNTATVGRRGVSLWTVEVEARTGHSSQIFREKMGDGAIFEAARILHGFYDALHGQRYLTFNPSVIVGGTTAQLDSSHGTAAGKFNVVPARAVVNGDLRFISDEQKEAAREKMRAIVQQSLPGTSAKITFHDSFPAMSPTAGNYALLKQLSRVSQDLGFGTVQALDPSERGGGDVSFVAHLLPVLDGIGIAQGDHEHAPGEWADLEPTPMLIKRAAVLIYRLTRETPP